MKSKKKYLIFYELHPINILPVIILSFFFKIAFWKKKYLQDKILKNFKQIFKPGEFTQGEWLSLNSHVYDNFKKKIENNDELKSNKIEVEYNKIKVNLIPAIIHYLSYNYENISNFYKLIELWSRREKINNFYIVDFKIDKLLNNINFSVDNHNFKKINLYLSIADNILEISERLIIFFKNIFFVIKNSIFKKEIRAQFKSKYFFFQFSGYDIASKKFSNDFSSFIINNKSFFNQSVFFLPRVPNKDEQNWLKKNKVRFSTYSDIFNQIPLNIQIKTLYWLFRLSFDFPMNKFKKSMISIILHHLVSDIFIMEYFFYLRSDTLIAWQGAGLKESPIVSIIRAHGKKTIFCSNSGIGVKHISGKVPNNYFYQQVEESITLSEYKFIWSKLDKTLLEKRSLNELFEDIKNPDFEIIGPIMSGDSNWMNINTKKARDIYNFTGNKSCKIWITIFDVPIFFDYDLINHRWPCNDHPEEMQNLFFHDIYLLLERFPEVGLIYKPKRPAVVLNQGNRVIVDKLKDFISKKNKFIINNRIVVLPHDVDPYIPMALSDYSIAMPFTSAAQAMLYYNKDSIYYDPSSHSDNVLPNEIRNVTLLEKQDLIKKIKEWIDKSNTENTFQSDIIKNMGNPRDNFMKKIKEIL